MILLARHGETDDNAPPRRVQGRADPPLNDRGREQARALAKEAAGHPIEALWCSHQRRAVETARIVGAELGLDPREDPRLAEADWGDWQGRLVEDIARAEPELWARFMAAEPDWRFPGGESLREHAERTWAALDDVAAQGVPALVVCHGGTIRCALARSHPGGTAGVGTHPIPNGALIPLP
ncbi:MAG TPA: histidine phosphatase family protein [Thermoleophilaceae bacterium]